MPIPSFPNAPIGNPSCFILPLAPAWMPAFASMTDFHYARQSILVSTIKILYHELYNEYESTEL